MPQPKIVLASSSPYRKKLLERLHLAFEVVAPEVDESPTSNEGPEALVKRLAIAKARAVAASVGNALIIGADQVAVNATGDMIGKPESHERAIEQLRQASANWTTLYTGVALLNNQSEQIQYDTVPIKVLFRELSENEIENYLRTEQPYDCTGSVKVEGLGIALLSRLEGDDPSAIIGLPLICLTRMLANEGVDVLSIA
ncbi:MAG: Maf family nucleotide pyrophosphatase [Gammaproteobacteria bacterium]|jgi:septum formation protein|nr:Maf family nucleotide pyrophosphatase [Gammaproteobacteria bacterium]